ncbi:MAG: GNAT family N-acetyltransferase [Bacteroidota bacterium]
MDLTRFHLPSSHWGAARQIRHDVFVVEQACPPEEEWDAYDAVATHLLGIVDAHPAATARWRVVDTSGGPAAKLERFAVLEAFRGRGLGRALVAATLADAEAAGHRRFAMHAQAHLAAFYAQFGFRRTGPEFDEVGISHVTMVLTR